MVHREQVGKSWSGSILIFVRVQPRLRNLIGVANTTIRVVHIPFHI